MVVVPDVQYQKVDKGQVMVPRRLAACQDLACKPSVACRDNFLKCNKHPRGASGRTASALPAITSVGVSVAWSVKVVLVDGA